MPAIPDNPYLRGATALIASQYDQRFSYCVYAPESLDWTGARKAPLLVVVHGSKRMAQQERDAFREFADRHGVVILAPLFPIGVGRPDNAEGYKLVRWDDIDYDRVVLALVEEAARNYPFEASRFLIHGFSGGGQFAHRFFYLHPQRCLAVSVGAPGNVTVLDDTRPWPVGTGGIGKLIGRDSIDLAEMRRVPVFLVVDALDTDPTEVVTARHAGHWMEGINDCGTTRPERLEALKRSLVANGIAVRKTVVPGVAHEGFRLVDAATGFFDDILRPAVPIS